MARPRWQYILLFLSFLSIALATKPTSFCKCTCFTNSTIIPLDGTKKDADDEQNFKFRLCSDCNRQFCLDYNLPICKDAKEEDVFTTCFQRDSAKDQAVVYIFIFSTVSLLGWAAIKPWYEKWRDNSRGGPGYAPVGARQNGGSN
ncbi:Hypothetical protein R9X50_00208700 [Acrodontium crateriforme]|uniref:Uncharacterized protein n=1 Tax=Acrodontium crateriforme TaxID=150365 RepID=A0AAQ3M0H9_9PEZI|nr:Hypothetical protein R9X50_00208700 [Acrodontium crateriforme]